MAAMYTSLVISEVSGVPEMGSLAVAEIEQPTHDVHASVIEFSAGYLHDPMPYEAAVGARCRVIRTTGDGQRHECGGSVLTVTPLVSVALDGAGWQ